jgi:two-component system, OmpR family, response regulator
MSKKVNIMRLLLVDDNPDMRFLIARILKREGYEIIEAENGAFASEILQTDIAFNAILSDTQMPLMDGFRLLQECKALYPHIPFILMTSSPTSDWHVRCIELGADYCRDKRRSTFSAGLCAHQTLIFPASYEEIASFW